jgi:rhodanese-related sulfurtransferase
VILALATAFTLYRVVSQPKTAKPREDRLTRPLLPGDTLALPGGEWKGASPHIVLFLSPSCHACNDSLPFYRALSAYVGARPGARLTVVSPESISSVKAWLLKSGVSPTQVLQNTKLPEYGVAVAPTLVLVNPDGIVTDTLSRSLETKDEAALWARVASHQGKPLNNTRYAPEIDEGTMRALVPSGTPVVVDIRDREQYARRHRAGALNIPADEIPSRAPRELSRSTPIVIDCPAERRSDCRIASELLLRDLGYRVVYVLVAGPDAIVRH